MLSNYLNCEAVVFFMKTVIPQYILLEGETIQLISWEKIFICHLSYGVVINLQYRGEFICSLTVDYSTLGVCKATVTDLQWVQKGIQQ